jgi:signal transduction histidine kinase
LLRLLAFGAIMVAGIRYELAARAELARAAALAERRRVARDLHDGLAQDLAFIAAHGAGIAATEGAEHPVAIAARRALTITREKISELSDDEATTAREALCSVAHELRDRFQIAIDVDAPDDPDMLVSQREDMARIVREAIANAARHGRAETVAVSLRRTPVGVVLRVCDDGCGINAVGDKPEGFGIRSMRERAAAHGASLRVGPRPTGGTELEVRLP